MFRFAVSCDRFAPTGQIQTRKGNGKAESQYERNLPLQMTIDHITQSRKREQAEEAAVYFRPLPGTRAAAELMRESLLTSSPCDWEARERCGGIGEGALA